MRRLAMAALVAALVGIDQAIKAWACQVLRPAGSQVVVEGMLQWTYVENYGAAFGIFQHQKWLLVGVTAAIIAVCTVLLWRRYLTHPAGVASLVLVTAGGLGNLIDRLFRGFVVDYIDINPLFSYPMFNFADCCVVIGSGLLVCYFLFWEPKEPAPGGGEHLG